MAFIIKGTAYVPLHEFEEWLKDSSLRKITEFQELDYSTMSFDGSDCISVKDKKGHLIDFISEDFWNYIYLFVPKLAPAEWQFGIPKISSHDIEVNFCASSPASLNTICDPDFESILAEVREYKAGTPFLRI